MLDVNTLPKSYRKVEEVFFDECSQLKTTIEKNRKKRKIFQNKCVSSQKGRIKKRRGRHSRGVSPTFSQAKQCGLVS
jgi:hypothetical protein